MILIQKEKSSVPIIKEDQLLREKKLLNETINFIIFERVYLLLGKLYFFDGV